MRRTKKRWQGTRYLVRMAMTVVKKGVVASTVRQKESSLRKCACLALPPQPHVLFLPYSQSHIHGNLLGLQSPTSTTSHPTTIPSLSQSHLEQKTENQTFFIKINNCVGQKPEIQCSNFIEINVRVEIFSLSVTQISSIYFCNNKVKIISSSTSLKNLPNLQDSS